MIYFKSSYFPVFMIVAALTALQSCGDSNRFTGPDYSEAPPPFDTTEAVSKQTSDDGLIVYTIEEGGGMDTVIYRDQIMVRYTGRTSDGEIFESTYRNGFDSPRALRNLTPESKSVDNNSGPVSPLIDGFRRGLLGMVEGEKRTIVVPPSLGYGETSQGQSGHSLSNETLIFDVELVDIMDN